MLTYDTLRKIFNEEKASKKLASLPQTFLKEVAEYFETKSKMKDSKDDMWELNSAKRTLQDIMETRERKLLTTALYYPKAGMEPENMTHNEKDFFNNVVKHLEDLQNKRDSVIENRQKMKIVALLADIPEFVGLDLKNYGPYKEGDIATVPEESAKVLIDKNAAKVIEIE